LVGKHSIGEEGKIVTYDEVEQGEMGALVKQIS
jgi:hypothetical protein